MKRDAPPSSRRRALFERIAAEPGAVRARSALHRAALTGMWLGIAAGLTMATFGAPPSIEGGIVLLGAALLAFGISLLAARLDERQRHGAWLVLALAWGTWLMSHASDDAWSSWTTAGGCATRGILVGLGALAGLLSVWRFTDPWSPRSTGALLGVIAAATTATAAGVPCPLAGLGHLVAGHLVVAPLLALVGAAWGHRVLAP